MKLLFATSNTHKAEEIRSLLPKNIELLTLKDLQITDEIPETENTLEGNSLLKAKFLFDKTGQACFAEDTGLEVEFLGGKPGVKTARFAGEKATHAENIAKLLTDLGGTKNRNARFKTVITYYFEEKYVQFTGVCNGEIAPAIMGEKGFGYDPVFIPFGSRKSFAEMDLEEKNHYSHRQKAFNAFLAELKNLTK